MAEPWSIHTLVFDLDDTLVAERDYVQSGFAAVDNWVCLKFGRKGFRDTAWQLFEAGCRGKIFDEAILALGLPFSTTLVSELINVYRCHEPRIKLLPDAQIALNWARTRFRLALISDGWLVGQQRKVHALGLDSIIPTIILTDAWGRQGWKPSPQAFIHVMQLDADRNANGYVYVGDNPRKDFIAPRGLGWRTVRIRRDVGEHSSYESTDLEAAEWELDNLGLLQELLIPMP